MRHSRINVNKEEIITFAESITQYFPERMSGNEQIKVLVARLANFVRTERLALVEVLRDCIAIRIAQSERKSDDGKREFWMWAALDMAKEYGLTELRPDIEALAADVHSGKTYLPYYEEMIQKCLNALNDKTKTQ